MGFFSRLFLDDDGRTVHADAFVHQVAHAEAADSGIDAKTAETVLAELDIDMALAAHENWKVRLQSSLHGHSTEDLRPDYICRDDQCELGKWLYGTGLQRLGKYPAFSILLARHKYFHMQASTVAALMQDGDKDKAEQVMGSTYRHASTQLELMLKELRRSLGQPVH